MSTFKTISGTYGCHKTPTDVFVYDNGDGTAYYVVEGGIVVNLADIEDLQDGVNVEEVRDIDCFTWSIPISCEEDFIKAVEY